MPWKLVTLIIIMILAIVFVGFNLNNKGDISLVFISLKDVPVTLSTLSAYVLGLITALVLVLGKNRRIKEKEAGSEPDEDELAEGEDAGALEAYNADDASPPTQPDESEKKGILSGLLKKKK